MLLTIMVPGMSQTREVEYTSFTAYDTVHNQYFAPYITTSIAMVNLADSIIQVVDQKKQWIVLNVQILNIKHWKGGEMSVHCVDKDCDKYWDINFYLKDNYTIMHAKSGKEIWIFKRKI